MEQVFVVGMPLDIACDKRAEADHGEVLYTRVVQGRLHQLARDALAFLHTRHFGVDEEDSVPSAPVFGRGDVLVGVGFRDYPIEPAGAYYREGLREFVLPYEVVRTADAPETC